MGPKNIILSAHQNLEFKGHSLCVLSALTVSDKTLGVVHEGQGCSPIVSG